MAQCVIGDRIVRLDYWATVSRSNAHWIDCHMRSLMPNGPMANFNLRSHISHGFQPSFALAASAISSAHAWTDAWSSPSIITRSSGSVPE